MESSLENDSVPELTADQDLLMDEYASSLKDTYVLFRRAHQPNFRLATTTFDNDFRRVAKVMIEWGVDPYDYMRWLDGWMVAKYGEVPIPAVTAIKMVKAYVAQRPDEDRRREISIRLQSEALALRLKNGETLEKILTDPNAEMTSIFRFAVAHSEKLHDIANMFRGKAERMLLFEPAYRKLLGRWLPEGM